MTKILNDPMKSPLPAALLLLACIAGALPIPATAATPIPNPPADRAHRFGVYAWGFDTAAYPAGPVSPDRLNWAADKPRLDPAKPGRPAE